MQQTVWLMDPTISRPSPGPLDRGGDQTFTAPGVGGSTLSPGEWYVITAVRRPGEDA
jgi:hypothetical protein